MARKQRRVPTLHFTRGKAVRLIVFCLLTAAGFFLSARIESLATFGWGYLFGLVGMAVLIG